MSPGGYILKSSGPVESRVSWPWATFSKPNPTQPKISGPNPTQPNPQKSSPDRTQTIIDTWYGILGYTENFIQQLLHVTDKFIVRS